MNELLEPQIERERERERERDKYMKKIEESKKKRREDLSRTSYLN